MNTTTEWGVYWPALSGSFPAWTKLYQSEEDARAAVADSMFDGVIVNRTVTDWEPA